MKSFTLITTTLLWALQAVVPALCVDVLTYDYTGCGKSYIVKGTSIIRNLKSNGETRSYFVRLPWEYDKDKIYPVVVGFHGSSNNGWLFEVDTGMSFDEFASDKIMIYPNGLGGAWAGASYSEASIDQDLQFVWDLLRDVRHHFCVDSSRIYAAGMSIGGGFVNTIACNDTVGGEFAAFGAMAGSFYTDNEVNHVNCTPARPLTPMIEIHGGADASVFYEGGPGEGGDNPDIMTWVSRWAERNQCDEAYEQEDLHDNNVHHLSWTCGGKAGALQHYKNDKQKHCWASKAINFSQLAAGDVPTYISATKIFIDFFMQFSRPAES